MFNFLSALLNVDVFYLIAKIKNKILFAPFSQSFYIRNYKWKDKKNLQTLEAIKRQVIPISCN